MKMAKQKFKTETNSGFAFINGLLIKTENMDERLKLREVYETYKAFCAKENYAEIETKEGLKRLLKSSGFKVEPSTKDNNQVHVFGVKFNYEWNLSE